MGSGPPRGVAVWGARLLVSFAEDQKKRGLRPATIVTRRGILRSLERAIAPVAVEDATTTDIETWLDTLKLSSRSRYTYLSAVSSFFDFARRQRKREDDPTKGVIWPRLNRLVPRPASPEDVAYAIHAADPMMAAWLSLGTFQGLRCFEIGRLRREDIIDNREPPLLVIPDGKGGRQDILTLNKEAELALHNFGFPRGGFFFLNRDGHPFKPATISRYIAGYLRGLGIEATAHQLRHLFVTSVWSATKDLRVTQEMARHADPRTTSGYAAFDQALASDVVRHLKLPVRHQREHLFG